MKWGLLILAIFSLLLSPAGAQTLPASSPTVVITIEGPINDFTRDTMIKRFEHARTLGARTVILQIDTYGGAVNSALEMSSFLKSQTDLHVIAYVPQKAISAGAMIALACNEIVMGPSAKMGDSAPISVGPGGTLVPLPDAERAKAESPILADFNESARRNGYDPLLVESMVSVGRTVYWVENPAGQRKFVPAFPVPGEEQWKLVADVKQPVDSADDLLTVTTDLALKLGLAKEQFRTVDELAAARNLSIIATLVTTAGERFVGWFNSPFARFLLIVVFLMSLYTAMHSPGTGPPEAIALISLSLLLAVPLLAGYAQWWEIIAILVGIGLIAIELFVIPGFGVAGVTGILLLLVGVLMTFVPKEPTGVPSVLPRSTQTIAAIQNGLMVIAGGLIVSLLLGLWIRRFLPRLPYFNRMILVSANGTAVAASTLEDARPWVRAGDRGIAASDLKPGGSGQFADPTAGDLRLCRVQADRGYIRSGSAIVVYEIDGDRVLVRAVDEA